MLTERIHFQNSENGKKKKNPTPNLMSLEIYQHQDCAGFNWSSYKL